jgi:hypothetical protein
MPDARDVLDCCTDAKPCAADLPANPAVAGCSMHLQKTYHHAIPGWHAVSCCTHSLARAPILGPPGRRQVRVSTPFALVIEPGTLVSVQSYTDHEGHRCHRCCGRAAVPGGGRRCRRGCALSVSTLLDPPMSAECAPHAACLCIAWVTVVWNRIVSRTSEGMTCVSPWAHGDGEVMRRECRWLCHS